MGTVLFEAHGLGRAGIHLGATALDLGIPGLGIPRFQLVKTPEQLECEPRTLLGRQSQDLVKDVRSSQCASVADVDHDGEPRPTD